MGHGVLGGEFGRSRCGAPSEPCGQGLRCCCCCSPGTAHFWLNRSFIELLRCGSTTGAQVLLLGV